MGLTLPEAMKRATNPVQVGLAKAIVTMDELAAVLPLMPVGSVHVSYRREGALPGTAWIPDSGLTTEESAGTDDNVIVPLRRVVGNVDVDAFADDLTGQARGEQQAAKLAAKIKATWREVMGKFVNGAHVTSHTFVSSADPFAAIGAGVDYGPWLDSNRYGPGELKYTQATKEWQFRAPGDAQFGDATVANTNGSYTLYSWNRSKWITLPLTVASATANGRTAIEFASTTNEFDGLKELIGPGQTIDPVANDGDPFDIGMLDKLITLEKVHANRAFIVNGSIIERFYAAYRALGGTTPQNLQLNGYATAVPTYRGIPILQNDFIAANETVGATNNASSIYLASLDETQGLALAVANEGGSTVTPDADPRTRPVMGFRIENLGPLEGKDARRTRVKFYGAPVLRSTLALARRRGVKTT
jgi:hypothetical protein